MEKTNKIYIGNISFKTGDNDLDALLGKFGPLMSVSLIKDKFTGKSKGFAFAEFENKEDMDKAIAELDGSEFQGRKIKVNVAQERPRENRDNRDRKPFRRRESW